MYNFALSVTLLTVSRLHVVIGSVNTSEHAPNLFTLSRFFPTFAISSSASTISVLGIIYPTQYAEHPNYGKTLSSLAFAGTVVGMLVFGYLSDKVGRKFGMVSCYYIHLS